MEHGFRHVRSEYHPAGSNTYVIVHEAGPLEEDGWDVQELLPVDISAVVIAIQPEDATRELPWYQ